MRSTLFPLALFLLSACGTEFYVDGLDDYMSENTPELGDEFDGPDGDVEDVLPCEFEVLPYFSSEDYEIVNSYPKLERTEDMHVTVHPGEEFSVNFMARSECGNYELNGVQIVIQDYGNDSYEWLMPVTEAAIPAGLKELTQNIEFEGDASSNMYCTPEGDELHYYWHDGNTQLSESNFPVNIPSTQTITDDGMLIFEFTLPAELTAMIPDSTDMEIYLGQVWWKDIATGTEVSSTAFRSDTYYVAWVWDH